MVDAQTYVGGNLLCRYAFRFTAVCEVGAVGNQGRNDFNAAPCVGCRWLDDVCRAGLAGQRRCVRVGVGRYQLVSRGATSSRRDADQFVR